MVGSGQSGGAFDVRPFLSPFAALAGVANVVMQLSRPAVGYAVKESRVESGSAMKHPLKRARTTFTYLAVAMLGDQDDRAAFRRAVDRQHAKVFSTDQSPVRYRGLDPDLQLWVAACLAFGLFDLTERLQGPLAPETAERLYAHAARLGTTLQVTEEMWPADPVAFRAYWEDALRSVSIDADIRDYLMRLIRLENLPRPLQLLLAEEHVFWTTGFLPPAFRQQMRLRWSDEDERRFARRLACLAVLERTIPVRLKALPFQLLLLDTRLRRALRLPLV